MSTVFARASTNAKSACWPVASRRMSEDTRSRPGRRAVLGVLRAASSMTDLVFDSRPHERARGRETALLRRSRNPVVKIFAAADCSWRHSYRYGRREAL